MNRERLHKTRLDVDAHTLSLDELGREIGRLRYDALCVVLRGLRDEIRRQEKADRKRARVQLATCLQTLGDALGSACVRVEKTWKVCRRHMKEDLRHTPDLIE